MFNIELIKENKYFKEKILKKDEILFDEGELDKNIYIIDFGKLEIGKYFSKDKTEKKILAVLEKNSIFGEGALSNNNPKEVFVEALEETGLFYISSRDFKKFVGEFTDLGIELLTQIINLSNKRLLESNFLLTSSYKISKNISEVEEFSNKTLFKIIDEFSNTLNLDYIIFAEKNDVLENYVKIIYDTRNKSKMLNSDFFEIKDSKLNLENLKNYDLKENNIIFDLKNKNKIIGFLILGKKENFLFSEAEKKLIKSVGVLIAGFVKQKQYFQEQKNKEN